MNAKSESITERAKRLRKAMDLAEARQKFAQDSTTEAKAAFKKVVAEIETLAKMIHAERVPCEVVRLSEGCAVAKGSGLVLALKLDELKLRADFTDKYPHGLPGSGIGNSDAKLLTSEEYTFGLASTNQPAWFGKGGEQLSHTKLAKSILSQFIDEQEKRLGQ